MRFSLAGILLFAISHSVCAQAQIPSRDVTAATPTPDAVLAWIYDPDQPASSPNGRATVNVEVLQLSDKARKELARASAAFRNGDRPTAVNSLEKVAALEPHSALAQNVLGVVFVSYLQYDKAQAAFEKALSLNPNYHVAADNLAVVFCSQHRWPEAEAAARNALHLQPEAASSQYLLGSVLVAEDRNLSEATALLENVKGKYPRALMFLAQAAMSRDQAAQAIDELQQYLQAPTAMEKPAARSWLDRLQQQEARKAHEPNPNGGARL